MNQIGLMNFAAIIFGERYQQFIDLENYLNQLAIN